MEVAGIQTKIDTIIKDFQKFSDWEERYRKIIQLGQGLAPMEESLKTEENKVKGCQSQVWLHAQLSPEGRVVFQGDSDAMIVKGLVALLLQVYSETTPEEILKTPTDFLNEIGLERHLSPSRANGLFSMIKQIRYYATAFQYLVQQR